MPETHEENPQRSAITDDTRTTVLALRELIAQFVEDRNWGQFHSPKNLSMALAIEAAELMEHFQWCSIEESRQLVRDEKNLREVAEELADVLAYSLALANVLDIDISQTLQDKMKKNAAKYPAAEFFGRAK